VSVPIADEFNCVGYFGFGDGVAIHRSGIVHGQPTCCSSCLRSGDCWTKHRDRVRVLLPALMKLMDDLVDSGLRGGPLVAAYAAKVAEVTDGEVSPERAAPPDIVVMMGNLEDGNHVAAGLPPKDRGAGTLKLPFES